MNSRGPVGQILRIVLLALVLAAQTLAHAHAADHDSPVGKTQCPVCSVAQPNGHAVVDCGHDATERSLSPPRFAPAASPSGQVATPPHQARAPPFYG